MLSFQLSPSTWVADTSLLLRPPCFRSSGRSFATSLLFCPLFPSLIFLPLYPPSPHRHKPTRRPPNSTHLPAMWVRTVLLSVLALAQYAAAAPYSEVYADYNINTNKNAQSPLEYSTTKRANYHSSPDNWRAVPFYTILLDKFADGDPSNNDYFGTMYEWDWRETQLRYGGDLKGLVSKLDYLLGMGIKGIFISGTPFINMPWQADSMSLPVPSTRLCLTADDLGYSPLDFSVLDPHWGTLKDWQDTIDEIHSRGMYVMADFTIGTMADLIGFKG